MLRIFAAPFFLFSALALSACNPMENLGEAEEQVDRFQTHFSSGEVKDMYAMAGPAFRESTTRKDFDDFVEVISARLGAIETSQRDSFNVKSTPGGTTTVVTMSTQFEKGQGTETYTFIGNGEDMRILGWQVNSDRLLISRDELDALKAAKAEAEAVD
jgi:hypothetical protein